MFRKKNKQTNTKYTVKKQDIQYLNKSTCKNIIKDTHREKALYN